MGDQTNNPIATANNSASVPAQNKPSSTPLPAAPDVNNAQAGLATPPPIAPLPGNVGPTTQIDPNAPKGFNASAGSKPSMAKKILQAATGGQTTDFAQGPNGPVPIKRDLTTGELARRVLASVGSIFAAGAGGALAAKQHRPFELAPGTTLGDIQNGPVEERQKQAQEQFNNTQTANEATLRAHRAAQEQMESIDKHQQAQDAHNAAVQAAALDPERKDLAAAKIQDNLNEIRVKNQQQYNQWMAEPGAQVMRDANGKNLDFDDARAAQDYVIKNPEALHGKTDGKSKFGVLIVKNPWTQRTQLIDLPADRHDKGIVNYGQKVDPKTHEPMFDKDNNPVPNDSPFDSDGNPVENGYVVDPKTGKPTVLSQTVDAATAGDLTAKSITLANTLAQMSDRKAQAKKYEAQAKADSELNDAKSLYESGNFDKMTDKQKNLYSKMVLNQESDARKIFLAEEANLARVQQIYPADSAEVKEAQKKYDEASDDYEDKKQTYNKLTDNTPGKAFANKVIRTGIGNTPWATIDKQITDATMSDDDKQQAKALIWNSLSPAQQAAANPTPQQSATGAPAGGAPAIPTPNTHIFDLNAWIAKNPNGDKAAAIKAAQDQGYTVKQ